MAEKRLRDLVPRLIERRRRALVRGAEPALKNAGDRELHALRIAVKHLRYNLEFFESMLGEPVKAALDQLALAQERLGTIADVDAFERFYDELSDHLAPGDPRTAGIRALRTAALLERDRSLHSLRELWSGKDGVSYPDSLAASISSALGSLSPKPAS
ncbi:MAG TPA: CHAD domain-containing protein [Candidatus Baltobacteraceae bacterium]|nr:CHAD domain-containing protein [Candidatus Baltobacteraceae bacterium]